MKNPLSEVFQEIEGTLIDHDIRVDFGMARPYQYSNEDFKACYKIFMSALMWKLWEDQERVSQTKENRITEAMDLGSKVNHIIEIYTGINIKELYQ